MPARHLLRRRAEEPDRAHRRVVGEGEAERPAGVVHRVVDQGHARVEAAHQRGVAQQVLRAVAHGLQEPGVVRGEAEALGLLAAGENLEAADDRLGDELQRVALGEVGEPEAVGLLGGDALAADEDVVVAFADGGAAEVVLAAHADLPHLGHVAGAPGDAGGDEQLGGVVAAVGVVVHQAQADGRDFGRDMGQQLA